MEYDTEYFYRVSYYTNNWSEYSEVISVTLQWLDVDGEQLPTVYALHHNYTNPFNPTTSIDITLDTDANVSVKVFNVMGQLVQTLAEGQMEASVYSLTWNASDAPSGMYFVRAEAATDVVTQKLMLVK